jgi:hypothetical protein
MSSFNTISTPKMILFRKTLLLLSSLQLISGGDALVPPEALVHTGVAALAGSAGAIAAYPIDYVKSQLQTEEGRAKYKNGIEAAKDIVRSSPVGPFALYRGVWVNILGIAPEKTIKLTVNDYARLALTAHFDGHLPLAGEMLSGGIAVSRCLTRIVDEVSFRSAHLLNFFFFNLYSFSIHTPFKNIMLPFFLLK